LIKLLLTIKKERVAILPSPVLFLKNGQN